MRASFLNRLTYTLCFFRASLLLTRALPVLLLLLLPMYYRSITRASFILSPSLWCVCVCVCNICHRTRAGKSEDEFENYIQTDEIVRQRILWNRMGYTHPFSNREFFRFFVFLFLSVSFRELWHSGTVEWNTTERERERGRKNKKTTFFSLFLKKANVSFLRGEWWMLLLWWMQKKEFYIRGRKRPHHSRSPFRSHHEKTALCDCIVSLYFFTERNRRFARSLFLFYHHTHTHTHTVLIARDWY